MKRKLSEYRNDYYSFSEKASDVSRQLAFAGIALIWIFRIDDASPSVPVQLIFPVAMFATALALDFMHYVVATVIWGSFSWYHEKKQANESLDPEFDAPRQFNWVTISLFFLKLACVGIGFMLLILYIWQRWSVS